MEYWINKVAVITNSGNDIGIHVIKKFEEAGLTVIGLCKSNKEFEFVTSKLKDSHSVTLKNVIIRQSNDDVEKLQAVFDDIVYNNGTIDVLINIANNDFDCTVTEGNLENFKKIVDTNVSAIAACIRIAACLMIEKHNHAHILTISNCQGLGQQNKNLFAIAKAAASSVNEILRHEFRYLNANIKTTHMEIEYSSRFDETSANKINHANDVAEMVINVLNTPENLQVHELFLDIDEE